MGLISDRLKKACREGAEKGFCFAVGYGTLISSPIWWDVINFARDPGNQYYLPERLAAQTYLACGATVLAAVLVTFGLFITVTSLRSRFPVLMPMASALCSIMLVWQVIRVANAGGFGLFSFILNLGLAGKVLAVGAVGGLCFLLAAPVVRGWCFACCRLMFPLLIVVFLQLAYYGIDSSIGRNEDNPKAGDNSVLPSSKQPAVANVVLIVFDELDYAHVFERRPPGYVFSAFDQLAATSIVFSNALPPSNATLLSIPSILDGVQYVSAKPKGPSSLTLRYDDVETTWGQNDNLIRDAKSLGVQPFITGWTHPYCRVLVGDAAQCFSNSDSYLDNVDVPRQMLHMVGNMLSPSNDCFFAGGVYSHKYFHRKAFNDVRVKSLGIIENYNGLHYIHLPVPHAPNIAQSVTSASGCGNSPEKYFGNVMVADSYVKDVIDTLKSVSMWDRTMVIVTSDHWWRASSKYDGLVDSRVPLFVKLPFQSSRLDETSAINTVFIRQLVNEFLVAGPGSPERFLAALKERGALGKAIRPVKFKGE